MADVTITQLTSIGAGLDSADEVPIWDVSGAVSRKTTIAQMNVGCAQLAVANTFTENQAIAKVDAALNVTASTGKGSISIGSADAGASWGGNVSIGRNSNASTPGAGFLQLVTRPGGAYNLWVDGAAQVRVGTSVPSSANDTSGTVVGTQTSSLDSKDLIEGITSLEDVLAAVKTGAEAVRRFRYKRARGEFDDSGMSAKMERPFKGEQFEGLVIDFAPRYGMDIDKKHPAGKSLNTVNVIGDLLRAVAWLVEREKARGA